MTSQSLHLTAAQAADITAFKATVVPVGEDQAPLIEQCNEIVRRINTTAGRDVLPEATAVIPATGRLPGIDGKAKEREIHDLKEALCEAKMATAVLAAAIPHFSLITNLVGGVANVLTPVRGVASTPYKEQGDAALYRRSMMARRAQARGDPYVERLLRRFYRCFEPSELNRDGMVRKEAVLAANLAANLAVAG